MSYKGYVPRSVSLTPLPFPIRVAIVGIDRHGPAVGETWHYEADVLGMAAVVTDGVAGGEIDIGSRHVVMDIVYWNREFSRPELLQDHMEDCDNVTVVAEPCPPNRPDAEQKWLAAIEFAKKELSKRFQGRLPSRDGGTAA